MNRLYWIFAVAVIGMSACASLPSNHSVDEVVAASERDIPSAWLLDINPDATSAQNWAAIYDDPLLLSYLARAKSENYDTRIARQRVIAAEASLKRAKTGLIPRFDGSLSVNGASTLADLEDASDAYSLGISGRWDPDLFGQTRTRIDQSRAALKIQEALAADTAQTVMASTARAYIRAVEAELLVDLARVNLEFLTESRRISEARYRLGDTSKGDFSFAEANYQSALASYENTLQSARESRRALSVLLGGFPAEDIALGSELLSVDAFPARTQPATVLENRSDVIAARAQVASRVLALKSAELQRWPNVSISGSIFGGSDIEDLFDPADYAGRLAASLSQLLFDGGAVDSDVARARAELDQSILAYEARLRSAVNEITSTFDRADTLQRTLANLEAASIAANEALRLESIQYDLGESSLLDVLQVQTRVNSIDRSLIRTNASLVEALISAHDAVGGFRND